MIKVQKDLVIDNNTRKSSNFDLLLQIQMNLIGKTTWKELESVLVEDDEEVVMKVVVELDKRKVQG